VGVDVNRRPATGNRQWEFREPGTGNREPDYSFECSNEPIGAFEEDGPGAIIDHRDLDVWRLGMEMATEIYRLTRAFPADERYGLISQMRRAAVSIPTNIAEGYGRELSGSYLQFLRIAQGSAKELQTLIDISSRLGFLDAASKPAIEHLVTRVTQMLFRLIRSIERNAK
jgi:four helix bundle protein